MKEFKEYLEAIDEIDKRDRMEYILNHIKKQFPHLKEEIKWNTPMYSDHGTFIIGFSISKGHISVSPEVGVISLFKEDIEKAGYSHTEGIFRIKWTEKVDLDLLDKMIAYNIEDKKDMTKFWR